MKRRLGILLRVILALVGLSLIVGLVIYHWHGEVVMPAGYLGAESPQQRLKIVATGVESGEGVYYFDPETGLDQLAESDLGPGNDTPTRIPGIPEMITSAHPGLLLLGLLLAGSAYPVQAARWLILMRCRGIPARFAKALRLTLVGQFFSVALPGATGGDLMKAYYAAKGSGAGPRAVMSVVADRIAGLVGLVLLVALFGLLSFTDPLVRTMTIGAWVVLAALLTLGWLYASRSLRRRLRAGALVDRLPGRGMIRSIDEAAVAYRAHPWAVAAAIGMSVMVHLGLASSVACIGLAVGIESPFATLMALIPVVLLMGAVPLMPSGLGVMEGAAVLLIDAAPGLVIGMMIGYRLAILLIALLGGVQTLRGGIQLHPPVSEAPPR